jgi:hypothetical protein
MTISKRTYYAKDGDAERLVRTTHPNRVRMHCAQRITVRVATQNDLERLLPKGTTVEDPDAKPALSPNTGI